MKPCASSKSIFVTYHSFNQYKKILDTLKNKNQEIEKKTKEHSQNTRKKCALYKRCLQHTIAYDKLVEDIEK